MLLDKDANYSILRILGSLCYSTNNNPKKDKFKARANKCIFLGYNSRNKGFNLYEYDTGKIVVSRDVVFHESCFPFKENEYNEIKEPIPLPIVPISLSEDDEYFEEWI